MDVRLTLLGLEVDLVQSRRRWCAGPVDEIGLGIVGWSRRGEQQLNGGVLVAQGKERKGLTMLYTHR